MLQNHLTNHSVTSVEGRVLTVRRVFSAPRELVFSTWTDPSHLTEWWGPAGFTITIHAIDVKPGGVWNYVMHGPDGTDYINKITYIEVERPELLEYAHGDDQVDEQFRVRVTFAEQGNATEITMQMAFKSAEELEHVIKEYGAMEGAQSTMERLAQLLARL